MLAHNDCVVCSVPAKWEFKGGNQKAQEVFWRAEETACEKQTLAALKSRRASSAPRLDVEVELEKENKFKDPFNKLDNAQQKSAFLSFIKRRVSI